LKRLIFFFLLAVCSLVFTSCKQPQLPNPFKPTPKKTVKIINIGLFNVQGEEKQWAIVPAKVKAEIDQSEGNFIVVEGKKRGGSLKLSYKIRKEELTGIGQSYTLGFFQEMKTLSFYVKSLNPIRLRVSLIERFDAEYYVEFDVQGGGVWEKKVFLVHNFKLDENSHDSNDELDMDQVVKFLITDISGVRGSTGENILWLDEIILTSEESKEVSPQPTPSETEKKIPIVPTEAPTYYPSEKPSEKPTELPRQI
jgi:hypothetical protein